jgi:hypothetical protein
MFEWFDGNPGGSVRRLAFAVSLLLLAGVASPAAASPTSFAASGDMCEVRSWEMTWGFKESFRSYLSGTTAEGGWSTSGNIGFETRAFTFTGSSGYLNSDGDQGELVTHGRIIFNDDELLNQTFSRPKLVIESSSKAALYFAVSGDTQEGVSVQEPNVRFAEINVQRYSVDPSAGLWSIVSAPTVLTPAGAEAFDAYPPGEMLDPMDIVIRVAPGCLERDNLVAQWLIGSGAIFAALVITVLVARRARKTELPDLDPR